MKIGLYFGSFNPIHVGHLIIASYVANNTDLDKVWLVVTPQNPLKPSASLLNEYHRLHLVRLAVEDDLSLLASDIEFKLPKPSYTVDTLAFLKERYPANTFSVIMGSDSYKNLSNWKNSSIIKRDYQIIVYRRLGSETDSEQNEKVTFLNAPFLDISSTLIRQMIKKGISPRYLLPEKVLAEINKNGYYKQSLQQPPKK